MPASISVSRRRRASLTRLQVFRRLVSVRRGRAPPHAARLAHGVPAPTHAPLLRLRGRALQIALLARRSVSLAARGASGAVCMCTPCRASPSDDTHAAVTRGVRSNRASRRRRRIRRRRHARGAPSSAPSRGGGCARGRLQIRRRLRRRRLRRRLRRASSPTSSTTTSSTTSRRCASVAMTMMPSMLGEPSFSSKRRSSSFRASARANPLSSTLSRRAARGRAPRTPRRTSRRRREGLGVRPDDHRRSRGGEAQGQDPHRARRARRDVAAARTADFALTRRGVQRRAKRLFESSARALRRSALVLRGGRGGSRRGSRRDRRAAFATTFAAATRRSMRRRPRKKKPSGAATSSRHVRFADAATEPRRIFSSSPRRTTREPTSVGELARAHVAVARGDVGRVFAESSYCRPPPR